VGAFRIIPYFAQKEIKLKHKIEELINMSKEDLDELVARQGRKDEGHNHNLQFGTIALDPEWTSTDPADLSDEPVKHCNKSVPHLVLFCDFLGPVFIQQESTSTSEVLLLALRTLAR
jgi:hypothetical protein